MLSLIPAVKKLTILDGFFAHQAIRLPAEDLDPRLLRIARMLPCAPDGAALSIQIQGQQGEDYTLSIREHTIRITAGGPAGGFYALQTLRQIFTHDRIPCLDMEDAPDFAHRGFYHDVTRGKIPTVQTLKQLIDQMAYYKLNSLQLYVEHAFAFEEYRAVHGRTGCMTREQMLELDAYCRENFIDFIPSLSTFGHLFELLAQEKYKQLRVRKDHTPSPNLWRDRMIHHTLDPENPQSIQLVESLIDQYAPCFTSQWFNICCDETFDLHAYDALGIDSGKLYVEFVQKIIERVRKHGKKVMMWADILLKYPHVIDQLPDDICFLHWEYNPLPSEERMVKIAASGKAVIVCPGTSSWSRLCEDAARAESNICHLTEYGYRHGAQGVLNTNWGDWGNPCSLELAMYGLVLGAERSWRVSTPADEAFYSRVNHLLYEQENGMQMLLALSQLHSQVVWNNFCNAYFVHRYNIPIKNTQVVFDLAAVQNGYRELTETLSAQVWKNDEYRQEMLLAAEGICVMAELWHALQIGPAPRVTHTFRWLEKYAEKWKQKNQPDDLFMIREMFTYCDAVAAGTKK